MENGVMGNGGMENDVMGNGVMENDVIGNVNGKWCYGKCQW